jgi:2-oxoglutarate ferredoxin oxidoreductase subunit alpha
MKFQWKIGGEAGFGIMAAGLTFSKIATRSGYFAYDYNEYPSLIRGGHNTYDVIISDEEIHAAKWDVDMLVCLNKDTFEFHKHRLTPKSIVVYDPEDFECPDGYMKVPVIFKKYRKEFQIQQIMVNTIALGASLAALAGNLDLLNAIIEDQFQKKGEEVISFNKKLAAAGYDYVKQNSTSNIISILKQRENNQQMVMTGNDAFSLAAVAADCRYYAAYPMTPSSTILTSLAAWQYKTKMIVRHSEDEIAVINSALGASFAGFALMVEALSYAGVAEIPVVVYLGQRPGPATGMPTWTEQGDLLFAVHAGHGEFPKIVLAPGDIYEMIQMTTEAFDLADIYQLPVIIISDKLLGESHKSHDKGHIYTFLSQYKPNRGKIVEKTEQNPYLRYKNSEDGISEMLIPGQKGIYYQANSYEHLEDSHTTESDIERKIQGDKRARKWNVYLKTHFKPPQIFGSIDEAEVVFVSWGGMKGIILEAQKELLKQGEKTAYIHFTHLYPMDEKVVQGIFAQQKRYVLIENNAHAQFGQLLRMQTGINLEEKVLKYDGRPFWPEEIVHYVHPTDQSAAILEKLKSKF